MSLFIGLLGKSASGKSEIVKHFVELIAFTTRNKRNNETDGVEYYFKDRSFIEKEIEKYEAGRSDYIVEYGEYDNNYYGTLKEEFEKKMNANDFVVNNMEIKGALKMREMFGKEIVKLIWIDLDEDLRIKRLQDRAKSTGESNEGILSRMNESHRDHEKELCDYIVTNNGTIEQTVQQIKEYVGLLKDENKLNVVKTLEMLKQALPEHYQFWNYYEIIINTNNTNNNNLINIFRLEEDIKWLKEIQHQNKDYRHSFNLIHELIEYLDSIYVLMKLED